METKQGRMHIGAQIQKRVKELGLTNSQFANLINCHRTNVNNIYKSETLDTLKLQRISEVLRFDFFQYYVSDYSSSSADEVISKRIEFSSEEMAKIAKNIPVIVKQKYVNFNVIGLCILDVCLRAFLRFAFVAGMRRVGKEQL